MRAAPTTTATHGLSATRALRTPRRSRTAFRFALSRTSFASDIGDIADGFVAEYELAGVKLQPLAKRQLREWYVSELQRASSAAVGTGAGDQAVDGSTVDAQASKTLPPLLQRRPSIPQLIVLWDLESVKPFTQQHRPGSVDLASDTEQQQHQQQRARAGTLSGRATRLAAAGLPGAGSSPDLIGALDQLCRTLMQYGTLHAVHLFLRESTLGKAPVLRRQVEQLHTWVGLREEGADEATQEQSKKHKAAGIGANADGSVADSLANPSSVTLGTSLDSGDSASGRGLQGRLKAGGGSKGLGARRRPSSMLPLSDDVHDCPMCRSAYPSRLDLLRHFAAAHQGPLLAATAADTRTQIMWTRGRPVGLPVGLPHNDPRAGAAAGSDSVASSDILTEKVVVNPEEFAYARELLMHGRHLDGILAAAPVAVHSVNPGAAASADANCSVPDQASPRLGRLTQAQPINASKPGGTGGSGGRGGSRAPRTLSRCGLHMHLVPSGQPAEAAAEALRQVADALALEQASLAAASLARRRGSGGARSPTQRGAGRAAEPQGRGRKGARKGSEDQEVEDAPVVCVCIVSDAEGLDQTLADLRQQDVLAMAVTRVSRVPSADVSLRWWAVQGGEYRLKQR